MLVLNLEEKRVQGLTGKYNTIFIFQVTAISQII